MEKIEDRLQEERKASSKPAESVVTPAMHPLAIVMSEALMTGSTLNINLTTEAFPDTHTLFQAGLVYEELKDKLPHCYPPVDATCDPELEAKLKRECVAIREQCCGDLNLITTTFSKEEQEQLLPALHNFCTSIIAKDAKTVSADVKSPQIPFPLQRFPLVSWYLLDIFLYFSFNHWKFIPDARCF